MTTLTLDEIIAKAEAERKRIWDEAEAAAHDRHIQKLAGLAEEWNPIITVIFAALPADLPAPAYKMPTALPEYSDGGYDYGYQTMYRPLLLSFGEGLAVLAYAIGDAVYWQPVTWSLDEDSDSSWSPVLPSVSRHELHNQNIWTAIADSARNWTARTRPTEPTHVGPRPCSYLGDAKGYLNYADNQGDAHSVQLAIAAAAIAQAEVAERQAQAMERIAALLESTVAGAGGGLNAQRRFIGVETLDKAF